MNQIERVRAVLAGQQPDRPPFSFWCHFPPEEIHGTKAFEAHVRHVETYDLDFLKIMDDNRYPRPHATTRTIESVADLDKLHVLQGDEDSFGRQLELIGRLVDRYRGRLYQATTIFNPWTTLRNLTAPDSGAHFPPSGAAHRPDRRDALLAQFLHDAPAALEQALLTIAESQANFVTQALSAGVDGVFMSTRDDWVDTPANGSGIYDRLVRPADDLILQAMQPGRFNLLHVCGQALNFQRFAQYPVHALNWADRYAGPALSAVAARLGPAPCGGVDNLGVLISGTPADCAAQVADALRQAGTRPILVAPGCTYDPVAVPAANLHAIRQAVCG